MTAGPYASDPARPATSALRPWWRWLFVLPGLVAVVYGVHGLLTAGSRVPLGSWLTWFVGSALLHDLVIAPIWIGLGWLAVRVLPAAARPALVVGGVVAGLLALIALPFVLGVGADPANPSFLPRAYGRNLLLVDAAVLLVAVGWATVASIRARSAADRAGSGNRRYVADRSSPSQDQRGMGTPSGTTASSAE
jgi:hypothetical protein